MAGNRGRADDVCPGRGPVPCDVGPGGVALPSCGGALHAKRPGAVDVAEGKPGADDDGLAHRRRPYRILVGDFKKIK